MVQIAPAEGLSHVIGDQSNRLLNVTLPEFFNYTRQKYGQCEAVVFSQFNMRWTYSELLDKCDQFAMGVFGQKFISWVDFRIFGRSIFYTYFGIFIYNYYYIYISIITLFDYKQPEF